MKRVLCFSFFVLCSSLLAAQVNMPDPSAIAGTPLMIARVIPSATRAPPARTTHAGPNRSASPSPASRPAAISSEKIAKPVAAIPGALCRLSRR